MYPELSNGLYYGHDDAGNRVCRGARMGRRNTLSPKDSAPKLYLRRLRFVDGDYDEGGAYWGAPANLWRAVATDVSTEIFVRANSRDEAKAQVCDLLPLARFFR